jgi:hypothetical protein
MRLTDLSLDKFLSFLPFTENQINILLQFLTSFICEEVFPCLTSIKSRERNRLISAEDELHVRLSKSDQQLNICAAKEQARVSH